MTSIYPLTDREDLDRLMATTNTMPVAPVEIRPVQVCIHMQIPVHDHVLRLNRQVSYMNDFLLLYMYSRQWPSCQVQSISPRVLPAIDVDADDSPVRHVAAVHPPIDLSPPPAKRRRFVLDVSP